MLVDIICTLQIKYAEWKSFGLIASIRQNVLKSRITTPVHNSFKRRDGSNRYTHIKTAGGTWYIIDAINPGGDNLDTEDQMCKMEEFSIDNINPMQYAEVSP